MFKLNVIALALLLTSSISNASNTNQNSFVDTLLICKNNINQLDLLPTILTQTGWKKALQDRKYPVFHHLFKKGDYEIGFRDEPTIKTCVVRLLDKIKLPTHKLENILSNFPSSSNKGTLCRRYGAYPSTDIEWEYDDNLDKNFIGYFTYFNEKKKLFSLGATIKHSKSGKYFSLCNSGPL